MEVIIKRHCVGSDPESGLSPLQKDLIDHPARVRIANAPTGAGKSYAFERAMERGERVLFMVPTRRLAQNLLDGIANSLMNRHGWREEIVRRKLAEWSSDATKRLKDSGVAGITAHRIRQISGLHSTSEEGEMIVAIPESVSHILMRSYKQRGQTDAGIFHLLSNFEHIVFDEFHTISARGFGLAGLMAKLAATMDGMRARVSFLSATPLAIRPVLARLGVPDDQVVELREVLTSSGRVIHGDVRLVLEEAPSMVAALRNYSEHLKRELHEGRQVVLIYDSLRDLLKQKEEMRSVLLEAGVGHRRALIINSISDSVNLDPATDFFAAGRGHNPEDFDVLIATASVEMGVTLRANLLLMEPGFEPLNFLQRYGRAARGDYSGRVVVRWDGATADKRPWFRELQCWVKEHDGREMEIGDLSRVLSRSASLRFEDVPEDNGHFGRLPVRAAYAAGLYWNVLMAHWSSHGARWAHLKKHQPKPAAAVYSWLRQVRTMEQDPILGDSAKKWCDGFKAQARTLRDIGARVRVIDEQGVEQLVPLLWLQRNTDILLEFPIGFSEKDGLEEIVITRKFDECFNEKQRYIPAMKTVRFPHKPFTSQIPDNGSLVDEWCRQFKNRGGSEGEAWNEYPEAMAAARQLVRLTGLVVTDDEEMDMESISGIL